MGWPQVVVFPGVICLAMAILAFVSGAAMPLWALLAVEGLLGLVLIWAISFFRDPARSCPKDESLLLAPADGRITDVEVVQEDSFLRGKALRIGIFLSVFDVHINRVPCSVKLEKTRYRKGQYKNALNPESSRVNERNDLHLVRTHSPEDRLIVRQISGAIARRIVCKARPGQEFAAGERVGMIKFGSRTELFVPLQDRLDCLVKIGDKVKAGLTPLARYAR